MSMDRKHSSGSKEYLALLGAHNLKELQDRIVNEIVRKLHEQGNREKLPVRLSIVAEHFLIRPNPEIISGSHDGEMEFDASTGKFIIKLCSSEKKQLSELRDLPRHRFTYAHEMAHRFFYIQKGGQWVRAIDSVTARLSTVEAMRERITLSRSEEGCCNSIARRLLMPEHLLHSECRLDEWFDEGEHLFTHISRAAKKFGVSLHCLLVQLQQEVQNGRMPLLSSRCLFLVEQSTGTILRRSQAKLRITTAIMPGRIGPFASKTPYPGMEWEKFGAEALCDVRTLLGGQSAARGSIFEHLRLPGIRDGKEMVQDAELCGWWRLLNSKSSDKPRKLILWGNLRLAGTSASRAEEFGPVPSLQLASPE
jgi:hypothetical protein